MATSEEQNQLPFPPNPNNGGDNNDSANEVAEEDDYDEVEDDDEEEEDSDDDLQGPNQQQPQSQEARLREQRFKLDNLFRRMQSENVPLRVHDVVIKGNTKTKDWVIEAELEGIKKATTMQELIQAASIVNAKLQGLEIFDSVNITLDAGPPELPGTTNVIIDVSEVERKITGEAGVYTKSTASSWTFEAALKYKNFFGYGDLWDGSLALGPNQTSEVSVGVSAPRFKKLATPVLARVFMLSQDWHEFSSYKERTLGTSLGLFSTKHHDLVYNLGWRMLTDPSQMSSRSIRRQLGHGLLSSLKYTFKLDSRNSSVRPIKGYAFLSTTQLGGLFPDPRSVQFLRQEFDLRYAVPLGFYHAALNLGVSGGAIFPWGHGFLNKPAPLQERFFLGGDFSPVCSMGGPTTVWGFRTRGLGPSEPRRQLRDDDNAEPPGRDFIGGDLAVTAFADLSFDLPIKWLRERGVHGHVFAGAGNVAKLTEQEYRKFSPRNFFESFRTSVGCGIVIPTRLFRLEGNYYRILKQDEYDRGKTGFRFCISPP